MICNTRDAVQLINEPTRETESTASLIDILITTKEECIRKSGVIKTSISDRYMLYAIRKGKKIRLPLGSWSQDLSKTLTLRTSPKI